ncbi:P-loop containing nucleoside triphosphate hydrolase protein [Dactylonectria macrodidyma]|uniref:P-loop containing nucleoside triphosphate hydrolase protein n=1 Tax=Dactylonectria macrodidyma TaxID=307937 RepID=A0A9P9FHG1_9HYPO|nr:P-loop containing nucleoside triphosphate hydrolase protein [Dactylonectria macrodidyma]
MKVVALRAKAQLTADVGVKNLYLAPGVSSRGVVPSVLIESDINNTVALIEQTHVFWLAPYQVAVSTGALVYILGWQSVLAGSVPALMFVPMFIHMIRIIGQRMLDIMQAKDSRVTCVTEALTRIKPLKLYGWQSYFIAKIDQLRVAELTVVARVAWFNALSMVLITMLPPALAAVSFGTSAWKDGHLESQVVFPCIAFFTIISHTMLVAPGLMILYQGATTSYNRVLGFIQMPQREECGLNQLETAQSDSSIQVHQVSVGTPILEPDTLGNPFLTKCNLDAQAKELVAITGPVGSGKTTLLRALLGEVPPRSGQLRVMGTIAFAPQQPFLMAATVRENILFGQVLDMAWYQEVVDACQLRGDFAQLPEGDATVLGGSRVTLSGGQCSRVALARCVYSRRSIVVLDDPLAAVDAKVARKLITNVLGPKGLLKDKLRVVVTSSCALTEAADRVYNIHKGEVSQVTELVDLRESAPEVAPSASAHVQDGLRLGAASDTGASNSSSTLDVRQNEDESTPLLRKRTASPIQYVDRDIVTLESAMRFIRSAKPFGWIIVIILSISTKVLDVLSVNFLKLGTEANTVSGLSINLLYFGGMSVLSAGAMFFLIMAAYHRCLLPASRDIHNRLTSAVIRSKMSFFDKEPMGELLNRFTNDINKIDSPVSGGIIKLTSSGASLAMALIILIVMLPLSVAYLAPLVYMYIKIQSCYRPGCRQLRKLENDARGPILDATNEIQVGAEVIRSYDQVCTFQNRVLAAVNDHVRVWAPWTCLDCWLVLRLNLLGCFIQSLSAISLVAFEASPGTTGLVMNYMLQITTLLTVFAQTAATLEADMGSIERIETYVSNPLEDTLSFASDKQPIVPPLSWPLTPSIRFHHFSASYATGMSACLRDLNFTIDHGERVAIVGRTGAGKSSLVLALMGAIDCVHTRGSSRIEIDGLDISRIRLSDLRSRMAVVPQEAVIFSGSLRDNLDPYGRSSDNDVRNVIRECRLIEALSMTTSDDPLTQVLSAERSDVSAGQMQLLSIARAILTRRKILILDEATASVDSESDVFIQTLIRQHFQDSTVITIAHRIETILDHDRILVMHAGKVVENDAPWRLLRNDNSLFSQLVKEAGLEKKASTMYKDRGD